MAKTTNKKTNGYKIVAVLLAVVLVAAFLVAGFGSSWFKNGNIGTWFNSWGKDHSTNLPDDPNGDNPIVDDNVGENGALLPSEVKGNGIRLTSASIPNEEYSEYGIEAQADSAYTVTAIIEPEEATNKAVKYTAAFENASSSWANGKSVSDYVTVAQTSAGSLTANVTIKQAFGEPVLITVTSDDDPEITANFPVHYIKRVTSITSCYISCNGMYSLGLGKDTSYTCNPSMGVGTVTGTFEVTAKIGFATPYFWAPLKNNQYCKDAMSYTSFSGSRTLNENGWNLTLTGGTAGSFKLTDSRDFITLNGGGDYNGVYRRLNTAIYQVTKSWTTSNPNNIGGVTFTLVNKFVDAKGVEQFRESKTAQADIKAFDMSAISVSVSSLAFPDGTVLYG